jgi:hypothetical protein
MGSNPIGATESSLKYLKIGQAALSDPTIKNLLYGKKGICMLTANRINVSKKHYSADAVAICMLLHQYAVPSTPCGSWVRLPFPLVAG